MTERYDVQAQAAQVAAVATLRRDEHLSYRKIAERLDLPLSTVHRRAGQVAELDDRQDQARGRDLRHEATNEVRGWLVRLEAAVAPSDDPLAERITLQAAFPLVLKAWEFLARLNGAALPMRVAVADDRRPPDPVLIEALRLEAERTGRLDEDEVRAALDEGA